MIKITENRFVNESKVLSANIYSKEGIIKVAIELDASNKEMATVYAGPFATASDATEFIHSITRK